MNQVSAIFRFLFRIKYWILFGPLLVSLLVFYFTANLPKTYEANTTIYTGITSSPTVDGSNNINWVTTNNSFDNIINLTKARSTLEQVSIKLLARCLVHGDPRQDNEYITSANYKELRSILPEDLILLIDTTSADQTYQNLLAYNTGRTDNFLYGLLNWVHPYFSITALSSITATRLGSSDMIQIKYSCDDPGIVHQTLLILNDVVSAEYEKLQLSASNDVVTYFENQLQEIREQLSTQEDSLMRFSMMSNIINFEEQTKQMTQLKLEVDSRYQKAIEDLYTSEQMVNNLERRLEERTSLVKENADFVQTLEKISIITRKINELETFTDESSGSRASMLPRYKEMLARYENQIANISNNISNISSSKDGVVLDDLVQAWLAEVLKNEKAEAEVTVLETRKKEIDREFAQFTPVGPNMRRQEREIAVTEDNYHTILEHLAQARLQQKNILMRSATLNVVSAPIYPLTVVGSKRKLIVLLAFMGSLFFILGSFLIVELLDKTIRDKKRALRLTETAVVGAFPGIPKVKHRGFALETNRRALAYTINRLMQHINVNGMTVINLISSESREGKTHLSEAMREYLEELGFVVNQLTYEADFDPTTRQYLLAQKLEDLQKSKSKKTTDILLIEYPPLTQSSIPSALIRLGQINLFITKSTRAWRDIDQQYLDQVKDVANSIPTYIYLNFASRFAVEDFTGQLPPYGKLRNLSYKLLQMELTPERNQNIEKE